MQTPQVSFRLSCGAGKLARCTLCHHRRAAGSGGPGPPARPADRAAGPGDPRLPLWRARERVFPGAVYSSLLHGRVNESERSSKALHIWGQVSPAEQLLDYLTNEWQIRVVLA